MSEPVINCCPECGANTGRISERTSVAPRYRCERCGETFENVDERPPKRLADRLRLIGEADD